MTTIWIPKTTETRPRRITKVHIPITDLPTDSQQTQMNPMLMQLPRVLRQTAMTTTLTKIPARGSSKKKWKDEMYPSSQYHVENSGLRTHHELFLSKSSVIAFSLFCYYYTHILYYLANQALHLPPCVNTWTFYYYYRNLYKLHNP